MSTNTTNPVIPAKAGIQCVTRAEGANLQCFALNRYHLDPSFASSRFAACLRTPLRWNDEGVSMGSR